MSPKVERYPTSADYPAGTMERAVVQAAGHPWAFRDPVPRWRGRGRPPAEWAGEASQAGWFGILPAALYTGIAACLAVIPLALICGPIRGIPFYWRLIDCSFGVIGHRNRQPRCRHVGIADSFNLL